MRWRKVKQNPKPPTQAKHKANSALPPTNALPHRLIQELEQNSSDSLQIANFWERGKAQVIDTFMIYLPLLYFLTYVVVGSAQGFRDSTWAPFSGVLIYGILVALLLAFKGQTPGKKAYNLWIVRENGKNVTFAFALLRFFSSLWRQYRRNLYAFVAQRQKSIARYFAQNPHSQKRLIFY